MSFVSPVLYQRPSEEAPGWSSSHSHIRRASRQAGIGGAPSHPAAASHPNKAASSSASIGSGSRVTATGAQARPRRSQSRLEGGEMYRTRKLSRSHSASSRALSTWVRRRGKGEEAEVSMPESPLSSVVKGLCLPAVDSTGPSVDSCSPVHSPSGSVYGSASSTTGGLSRLFSVRRKGRTTSAGAVTSSEALSTSHKPKPATSQEGRGGPGEQRARTTSEAGPASPPLAIIAADAAVTAVSATTAGSQPSATDGTTQASTTDERLGEFVFPSKSPALLEEREAGRQSSEEARSAPPVLHKARLHRSKSLSLAGRLTSRLGSVDGTRTGMASQDGRIAASSPLVQSPSKGSLTSRIRKFSFTKPATSPAKAGSPTREDSSKGFVGRSPSILNALDLRHSAATMATKDESPAVQSSTASPSLVRNSQRRGHDRAKTASGDGLTQVGGAISQPKSLEGRVKKLGLRGLNPFKATPPSQAKPTSSPELVSWRGGREERSRLTERGEEGGQGERHDGLGLRLSHLAASRMLATPDLPGSPMSSRALLRAAGIQSRMSDDRTTPAPEARTETSSSALGFIPGEESCTEKAEFVSGLNAISSGWTEASSVRSSTSRKREPVPSLHVLVEGLRPKSWDSAPASSSQAANRPYSLISTDTEGNDTPIVRLQSLVVDTREGEGSEERESQLFFRPPTAAGGTKVSPTTSVMQDTEELHEEKSPAMTTTASDAGLLATNASIASSGSSTLNARVLSEQMQTSLLQRQKDIIASQPVQSSPEQKAGPYVQAERRPSSTGNSKLPSRNGSGPPPSAHASYEEGSIRRESLFSSQTDSSVHDAVLTRATSTRLHTVPLRKMKVEEWAQKIARSEQGQGEGGSGRATAPESSATAALQSGPRSEFTFRAPAGERSGRPSAASVKVPSTMSLSEAARLGKAPSKRARKGKGQKEEKAQASEVEQQATTTAASSPRTLKPSRSANGLNGVQQGEEGEVRKAKSEMRGERSKASSGHAKSQSVATKRSFLTSEEAATAKRKEQEEQERRSKERRAQREAARQEAYAEKKRNDPLLRMRLALAGLAPPDEADREQEREKLPGSRHTSRLSFTTAEKGPASSALHHQRNKPSTASAQTVHTRSRASSTGTLANSSGLPFPQPPQRHHGAVKSDDGTVLAHARLQSHDGILTSFDHQGSSDAPTDQVETPKAQMQSLPSSKDYVTLLDGQRLQLSQGALMRQATVREKKPEMVIDSLREQLRHDDEARLRRSHVPEVHDRYSTHSLVSQSGP